MSKNRILVVEDDPAISDGIAVNLLYSGYDHVLIRDGNEAAQALLHDHSFDLALLDIMLPGLDGFALFEHVKKYDIPVIFITAKTDSASEIKGLLNGAEDYIVKPFSPREVIARIKAVLRRISEPQESVAVIRYEGLEINLDNYQVKVNNELVSCTPKEVEILHLLASHVGQVMDREQILSLVWGYDYFGDTRTVDTHIKMLRESLGAYRKFIVTVWGTGYKFETGGQK